MMLTPAQLDPLPRHLPDFSACRVLVAGDVMLDRYWTGAASRISPEAPVPVLRIATQQDRAGGAGNVALNIAALGSHVRLLGLIGDDIEGQHLQRVLQSSQVDSQLLPVTGARTVTKLRLMARHQQLLRADFEDDGLRASAGALGLPFASALGQVGAVVLSDYAKGALDNVQALIAATHAAGKPVVVDPKGSDFERYRGATVITPNLGEFEAVVGRCADEAQIERRARDLLERLDLDAVLVTRSEQGMTLVCAGRPALHVATRAQEVYDVTGAGDTVVAVVAASLAVGLDLPQAAGLANVAAGLAVAKLGAATVSPAELRHALQRDGSLTTRGIVDEADLLALVEAARAKGERVVMTNGSFDLLHPGHIDYLERARALGDRLVVAVNDDASVRRYKGVQRPVNPLATRLRMLAALGCVDWVVPFSEDTPTRLVARILPDILVKGGDYANQRIAGADAVEAAGGQVRILDFLPGYSTTALVQRIRSSGT